MSCAGSLCAMHAGPRIDEDRADHLRELIGGDEKIIHSVHLFRAGRARGRRDDEVERQIAFFHPLDHGVAETGRHG